jgi:hypothetical protein
MVASITVTIAASDKSPHASKNQNERERMPLS